MIRLVHSSAYDVKSRFTVRRKGSRRENREKVVSSVMDLIEEKSGVINIVLGSIIDIADGYRRDCTEDLRKEGIYKMTIKQEMKKVEREMDRLKRTFHINTANQYDLYLDALDTISEEVSPDLVKLYYPIKSVLDKYKVGKSEAIARQILMATVLSLAEQVFNSIVEYIEETAHVSGVAETLCNVNPQRALHRWDELCKKTFPLSTDVMEAIANDSTVKLGGEIIQRKLINLDYIESICAKVVMEHKDLIAEYYNNHPEIVNETWQKMQNIAG